MQIYNLIFYSIKFYIDKKLSKLKPNRFKQYGAVIKYRPFVHNRACKCN